MPQSMTVENRDAALVCSCPIVYLRNVADNDGEDHYTHRNMSSELLAADERRDAGTKSR